MSTPDQERLAAIEEALSRILRRQDELEGRFRQLEWTSGYKTQPAPPVSPPPEPKPRPAEAPVAHPGPPPLPPPLPARPAGLASLPPPPASQPALETQVGLNWVNRIAVITLIFGAAFFFKYAVDNNWIGPGARVALGIVAAMLSLGAGDRMWHRDHKVFAQGLTGLGLALLYLSFYATFGLYHLLPQGVAFLMMILTTASAVVFAVRYESQVIAVLGLAGGYLTPVTLSTGEDHPWVLFSYTFLLNLGGLALARFRRWRAVEYVAFAATMVLYAGWHATWFGDRNRVVATVFVVAFYAQFVAATGSRIIWALAQLAAAVGAAVIRDKPADLLLLQLLFAAGGLAVAELRAFEDAPPWTLFSYWLAYGLWIAAHGQPHDRGTAFGLLSAGFLLFFAWIPWCARARRRALRSPDLVVLAANSAIFFGASYVLLNPVDHDYMGLFAVALGGLNLLIAKLLWKPEAADERERWPVLLALAITLTFLTLAVPIQFSGFRITVAWALEGAALAWLAARFDSERLRLGAWVVLVMVFGRLFLFDSWIYTDGKQFTAVVNARFLTFTASAVSLWLAARFAGSAIPAAVPYVAGHFVMLWILGLEVTGWAQRSIARSDLFSVETTAVSILMALYALMLVALGVSTRTVINRMLGLALMALVVVKLYLSDVWELGRVFRITAFLGLGVLLLLLSYLYSRFKPVIERLWRNDPAA